MDYKDHKSYRRNRRPRIGSQSWDRLQEPKIRTQEPKTKVQEPKTKEQELKTKYKESKRLWKDSKYWHKPFIIPYPKAIYQKVFMGIFSSDYE